MSVMSGHQDRFSNSFKGEQRTAEHLLTAFLSLCDWDLDQLIVQTRSCDPALRHHFSWSLQRPGCVNEIEMLKEEIRPDFWLLCCLFIVHRRVKGWAKVIQVLSLIIFNPWQVPPAVRKHLKTFRFLKTQMKVSVGFVHQVRLNLIMNPSVNTIYFIWVYRLGEFMMMDHKHSEQINTRGSDNGFYITFWEFSESEWFILMLGMSRCVCTHSSGTLLIGRSVDLKKYGPRVHCIDLY